MHDGWHLARGIQTERGFEMMEGSQAMAVPTANLIQERTRMVEAGGVGRITGIGNT